MPLSGMTSSNGAFVALEGACVDGDVVALYELEFHLGLGVRHLRVKEHPSRLQLATLA